MVIVIVIMVLNFAIAFFNAYSCGRVWAESKQIGGWLRFMVWMGATMSACGFSYVYIFIEVFGAKTLEGQFGPWGGTETQPAPIFNQEFMEAYFSLGYLVIIGPVLFSGIMITIDSWMSFARRRDITSGALAGWNTFAQVHNTYRALQGVPAAFDNVAKFFSKRSSNSNSGDSKGKAAIVLILLVAAGVIAGIATTAYIILATARRRADQIELQYRRAMEKS